MSKAKKKVVREAANTLPTQAASGGIPSDVLGSYTGTGIAGERPIQDADDL